MDICLGFSFLPSKREELISRLCDAGFVVTKQGNVYVSNPKEDHPKILGHHLPVAFMRGYFYKPVNINEPSLREHHEKLETIYFSMVERLVV